MTIPNTSPQSGKSPAPAADREEHSAFTLTTAKRPVFEDLVDMTAMVDIVFFLLIFFMVTSMQGVYSSINMPAPDPQKTVAKSRRTVTDFETAADYVIVRIDRDSSIWLDNKEVPSEQDLREQLRAARHGSAAPNKMLVLGSGDARHAAVVMVLDAGSDAGMEEVQLAVDEEL